MNIRYELNLDDVLAYHSYLWDHNTRIKHTYTLMTRISVVFGILMLILAVIDVRVFNLGAVFATVIVILGTASLLFAVFWPKIWRGMTLRSAKKRYSRKSSRIIGKHELSITPEGVTDVDEIEPSLTRWDEIISLESDDKYLFLVALVTRFHIVPKRAFPDESSFKQFAETANGYHQSTMSKR
jgi:hypothetical protein